MNDSEEALANIVIINNCQVCNGKGMYDFRSDRGQPSYVIECSECHGVATSDKPITELAGTLGYRRTSNDLLFTIQPLMYGALRLTVGSKNDLTGYDKAYDYGPAFHQEAFDSLREWDGNGDPLDGWHRSFPPYYRRRKDGDPDSEVVRP